MKTIRVFIASSNELKAERQGFSDLLPQLNRILKPRGTEVEIVRWEDLDASMGPLHKQEEYNRELKTCEICVILFWRKFGEYTGIELDTAYTELCAGHNPQKIYVYFKDTDAISPELKAFKESFATKDEHFYSRYLNLDTLLLHFVLQFEAFYNNDSQESLLKIRDSKVEIGGQPIADLQQVPFAANNPDYQQLLREINRQSAESGAVIPRRYRFASGIIRSTAATRANGAESAGNGKINHAPFVFGLYDTSCRGCTSVRSRRQPRSQCRT